MKSQKSNLLRWGLFAAAALPLLAVFILIGVRGINAQQAGTITLNKLGTYNPGPDGDGDDPEGASEIVAFDPETQQLYTVNALDQTVDILDASDPTNITRVSQIDITPFGDAANSVDVYDGIVVAAVQNEDKQANGKLVFFDADGNFLNDVEAGALPDMVTFTPDGMTVLAANEGEPNDEYTIDPEGTITIVDVSGGVSTLTPDDVMTADFTAFNGREEEMRARGIRIYQNASSLAQDVEPEYIAVSPDSTTAFVTLQEANAFAVVDIATATVEDLIPMGLKDHSQGYAELTSYPWSDLPDLGTTPAGQTIKLGGLSGLWYEGMSEEGAYQFVTVPDRGPNGDPTDVDNDGEAERPFVLPDYQARVIRFELDPTSAEITITETIMLTTPGGDPITGLPNIPDIDETPVDLNGDLLPYDPLGADLEGVLVAEDGTFWMVDEYRPAIYHFDEDGVLIDRLVPEGTAALAGEPEGTFGTESLPAEYANRRPNRGFEAMAFDTDTGILYAFIQTPLANPDRDASDNSNIIRMLGIDPSTGEPVTEYVYLLEKPSYRPSTVDKIGDAVYAGDGKFYVIERDSSLDAYGKKYIFEADLFAATNVLGMSFDGGTLEQQTADSLAAQDVNPVYKRKVTNLPSIGYLAGDKPEGLAMIDESTLAVLNDNDFGLLPEPIPGDGSVAIDPSPTQIVLGIISFGEGNQLDASDEDGGINIQNWPVFGNYMPDAIAAFEANDAVYYLTANEGDARDYDGFSEEERMDDLLLNSAVFPDAATLQMEENIGRLKTSNQFGDLDGDGTYEVLHAYGARSFSVWDAYGNLVFDSGDAFANITAAQVPDLFNSQGDADSFDSRSDDKGAEPEAIAVGDVYGRTLVFVGLERIGGIMVYDVTDPTAPAFLMYQPNAEGDQSPEGLKFISAEKSPTGTPLLAVANEISGTTTLYEVETMLDVFMPIVAR